MRNPKQPPHPEYRGEYLSRRDLLKRLAVMLGGGVSVACQQALQVPAADRLVARPAYDDAHRVVAHRIADLIIPETDTPGAAAAGVGEFIDYVVAQWFKPEEKAVFLAGLADVQSRAQAQFQTDFTSLAQADQVQLLEALEPGHAIHRSASGARFTIRPCPVVRCTTRPSGLSATSSSKARRAPGQVV